ncbi:phage tail assembly chaperone [Rhizobium sp. CFBP 8762]|nr:phage tail assembly chaperone [Rhizobium sp. CFBP 8762]
MLHTGLHLLRLEPQVLWAMTPKEFHAATGGLVRHEATLTRADLAALMRQFPDEVTNGR